MSDQLSQRSVINPSQLYNYYYCYPFIMITIELHTSPEMSKNLIPSKNAQSRCEKKWNDLLLSTYYYPVIFLHYMISCFVTTELNDYRIISLP